MSGEKDGEIRIREDKEKGERKGVGGWGGCTKKALVPGGSVAQD